MLWGRSLYRSSLVALLVIFGGLEAVVFIDIIPQSFQTGQFWNAIIVISALIIYAIIAIIIFAVRLSRNRVWLHSIPRDYTLSRRNTPSKMMDLIDNCSRECRQKFQLQVASLKIDHPGLQNPRSDQPLEIPYSQIAEIIPRVLEDSITAFYPRLVRKPTSSLRQYLYSALSSQVISQSTLLETFLNRYEAVRFGASPFTESQFYGLFESLLAVLRSISVPEHGPARRWSGVSSRVSALSHCTDSGSVVIRKSSFLHPLSRSFADTSELSLTDLVQHACDASRRGSEAGGLEDLSRTDSRLSNVSMASCNSNQTFVHYA